jgi:hypothetical protein
LTTDTIYYPADAGVLGETLASGGVINIGGRSGVGKSFLIHQMTEAFGLSEVLVLQSEMADHSYQPGTHVQRAYTCEEVTAAVKDLIRAQKKGQRLPRYIFWDSLSSSADHDFRYFEAHPFMNEKVDSQTGATALVRDKWEEYRTKTACRSWRYPVTSCRRTSPAAVRLACT